MKVFNPRLHVQYVPIVSGPPTIFEESLELFGKWLEIFGKSYKMSKVIRLSIYV